MNFTEPIRDIKKISQIKNILKGQGDFRNLLLFTLGINSALRISDLHRIKVNHLFDENLNIKGFFNIKEQKTGKINRITITPGVGNILKEYKKRYPFILKNLNNFVFFNKNKSPIGEFAIGRKTTWVFLNNICKNIGLEGSYGNHSLRKTWGYQARKQGVPLEIIQHKLNHSSLSVTQRYLGITAQEIENACNKLDL